MVRAILDGRKTQTRRIVRLPSFGPTETPGYDWIFRDRRGVWNDHRTPDLIARECPYGPPGSILWVREAWAAEHGTRDETGRDPDAIWYRADGLARFVDLSSRTFTGEAWPAGPREAEAQVTAAGRWRPAISMPRWAARIRLEVVEVRVERLREISESDAIAEGVDAVPLSDVPRQAAWSRRQDFSRLWDAVNGKRQGCSWEANPWVWAIEFRRSDGTINERPR